LPVARDAVAEEDAPPDGEATTVVTPEALVVATGPVSVGEVWLVDVDEPVTEPGEAVVTVPVVVTGIVLARAAVAVPTPSTSAASDQFETRLTWRSPLSRGEARGGSGMVGPRRRLRS